MSIVARMRRMHIPFVLTMLLPTLLALLYYGVIASDVYISESRFVVRNPESVKPTGLGALLQGTSLSASRDDTYSVHDFILSRDALRQLDDRLAIRAAYSSRDVDVFNRFPGLDWDDSFENFHDYYLDHVTVEYDPTSSIAMLRVQAYSARHARDVNELLLVMGERLVNTMNQRSRQDLIHVAKQEVALAEQRAKDASLALSAYRTDRSVFDPNGQSALQLEGVSKLQAELITAEQQLEQVRRVSPDNPQVRALQARVASLQRTMRRERAQVIGVDPDSLAAKAPAYDRLLLEKTFADRQLATTLAGLETARNEAQRKQLYLERLVQPNLPDEAMEPRRLRSILTVFVLGLIAWGVLSLVVAGVQEHVD